MVLWGFVSETKRRHSKTWGSALKEQIENGGLLEPKYYHLLRHRPDGSCIFLEPDGKKFACKIYEDRPQFCAKYPSNTGQLEWCKTNKLNKN